MSDLTKRLRERKSFDRARGMTIAPTEDELAAADRIDALEERLRECVYCLEHDVTVERSMALLDKSRALLEEK